MEENQVSTPNEVKTEEAPHLTEAEIESFQKMSKLQRFLLNRADWNAFLKLGEKPERIDKPKTFDEKGKVVVNLSPKEAPIRKGNIRKGTLRNKPCSCGSKKAFKRCCLRKNNG